MSEQGRKYDGGKLRYDLIPVLALEETTKVVTKGAEKYDDENWKLVPEGRRRYLAAAIRHIQQWRKGEVYDEEMGTHHIANAISNLMFILEKELQGWEDVEEFTTDAEDISTEELKAYVDSVVEVQKPVQCEYCDYGWLPWPRSNKHEGSPCHMCLNGEIRKSKEDGLQVDVNGKVTMDLWYPPVEDGGNPWIEWNGMGFKPDSVSPSDVVEFLMDYERKARCFDSVQFRASSLSWRNESIVAYRVV